MGPFPSRRFPLRFFPRVFGVSVIPAQIELSFRPARHRMVRGVPGVRWWANAWGVQAEEALEQFRLAYEQLGR